MSLTVHAGPAATDITDHVLFPSLVVTAAEGGAGSTCTFEVEDPDGSLTVLVPEAAVRIDDGATAVFAGIVRTRVTPRSKDPRHTMKIGCQDNTQLLSNDVCDGAGAYRYATESDHVRIEWLLSTYCTTSVTMSASAATLVADMPDQWFEGMNVYEAVADVCRLTGGRFYVDTSKVLHYFSDEASHASFALSDAPSSPDSYGYASIERTEDTTGLVNAVYIVGEGVTGWRTDAGSITTYGRQEGAIRDKSITVAADLNTLGDAYLAVYDLPRTTYRVRIFQPGLVAGQTVHVTNADFGLTATDLVLRKMTITPHGSGTAYDLELGEELPDLATIFTARRTAEESAKIQASLAQLAIDGANILDGTITGTQIDELAIQTTHLAANAVTAAKIYANTITASELAANCIDATKIAACTLDADVINSGSIAASQITTGNLAADVIVTSNLSAAQINAGTMDAARINGGNMSISRLWCEGASAQMFVGTDVDHLAMYVDWTSQIVRFGVGIAIQDSPTSATYVTLACDAQGRLSLDDVVYSASGLVTRQVNGAVSDSGNHNLNGAIAIDYGTTPKRIYVRYGGGWHYASLDGGFVVPAHERTCPACSEPLLPGEDLIGVGDRETSDGSLHGLWKHLRCAGVPTRQEIADDYWTVMDHPDLDADPKARKAQESLMSRLLAKVRS
ncbi:MAG: hypothetical protein V2A79_03815 [Planctomycetota bacterium]